MVLGSMGAKVIKLDRFREFRTMNTQDLEYRAVYERMDKVSLLNAMVDFQEERAQAGQLTPSLMIRGKSLFGLIENRADTDALRALARSYRRHLEHEYEEYIVHKSLG